MGDETEERDDYEGLGLSADISITEFIQGFMEVDPDEVEEPEESTENGEDE